jgi:hypothetical protein
MTMASCVNYGISVFRDLHYGALRLLKNIIYGARLSIFQGEVDCVCNGYTLGEHWKTTLSFSERRL